MHTDLTTLCVGPDSSIHQALAQMDVSRIGIVLVVGQDGQLLGTITDGDVRRAILANISFDEPVDQLLASKTGPTFSHPITAPVDADRATILRTLQEHNILHLPLVDLSQRVVAVATLDEFVPAHSLPVQAVIMAGGAGSRMLPLTEALPKPMLPVGDRPLLEVIIEQLRAAGIKRVNLATHYKAEIITQHFGDGRDFGLEIGYVEEVHPLGTAGALSQVDTSEDPILVINGDILTGVDHRAMLEFHREHQASLTVAVRRYEFRIPYGVVDIDGFMIKGLSEKPVVNHFINAGIYLLNPNICRYVPADRPYDMPELIEQLIADGQRVVSFPVREYWLDIGQVEDYQKALADLENGEV